MNAQIPNEGPKQGFQPKFQSERHRKLWPVVQDLLQSMLKHDILFSEREEVMKMSMYCIQNLFASMVISGQVDVTDIMLASTERTMKSVEEFFWGKDSHKVTFSDMDDMMKKWFEWNQARAEEEGVEAVKPPHMHDEN